MAQMVKRLPTMQETRALSLGQEGPLEKEMATHSSTLAWKIPWMEEHGRLQSILPYICNCKAGFVSNLLKAFELQMVVQAPLSTTASSNCYLGPPGSETLNMRVRRMCCLNSLGIMPHNSMK